MSNALKPIGLICAIPEEMAALAGHLDVDGREQVAGFSFTVGRLDGRAVVVAEAGIGKVNAAVVGTLLLHHFSVRGLLFSGVAGGLDPALAVGDVVIAERLIQHDYGAMSDGRMMVFQPGVPPLPGFDDTHGYSIANGYTPRIAAALEDIELTAMPEAERLPIWRFGTVLTGDHFLNCASTRTDLHTRFNAQAVEMEGAALAQVAEKFGAPLLVVRALSDLAGSESHLDFPTFARIAAVNAATIVRRVLPVL